MNRLTIRLTLAVVMTALAVTAVLASPALGLAPIRKSPPGQIRDQAGLSSERGQRDGADALRKLKPC
jgi:hypothetical protein